MKAHQRIIREQQAEIEASENLFGSYWDNIDVDINKAILKEITFDMAEYIIKKYEYLGTMCGGLFKSFGIFWDGWCGGVVCVGEPTSKTLADSVCGPEYADKVIQIQRGACVHWAHPHSASKLISYALKQIRNHGYRIVIAFADPMAGEIGTVYQATNWLYCGLTAKRPDYFDGEGNRITGHVGKIQPWMSKKQRPRKGRYVYFLGKKGEKKQYLNALNWPILPYPKREED